MADEMKPQLDAQDPLPESNWFWRRVFTFTLMLFLMWRLWYLLDDLANTALLAPEKGIGALLVASRYILLFAFAVVTYYLLAPSAEQVTKMFKTAALLKHGVQFASRSVERPGHKEVASTAGQPPQPIAPPVDQVAETSPPGTAAPTAPKKETEILE